MGDRVLIETGQRLLAETREVDTVCRLGGDEFVALCSPVDGWAGLKDLAGRLASMPPVTVFVKGVAVEVAVSGSIGSVMVEADEDLDLALRRADAAMYRPSAARAFNSDQSASTGAISHVQSAVDGEYRPGDVTGVVVEQEPHGPGHFVGRPSRPTGMRPITACMPLPVWQRPFRCRRSLGSRS